MTWNFLGNGKTALFRYVDDTLGVIHTHGVAAIVGGLGVGILADPKMIEYYATGTDSAFSVTGWWYGNFHQVVLQIYGAAFIIVWNVVRHLHPAEDHRPVRRLADGRRDPVDRRRRGARRGSLRDLRRMASGCRSWATE